jgi:uncharacterized Zn finger protein
MSCPYIRPICPACGMNMVVINGFGEDFDHQSFECLRCGHVDEAKATPRAVRAELAGRVAVGK